MRWFSGSGEFAFLSFGGVARGIIAIGGTAHGVVALGGIASAGVISIGMNAAGSVLAIGMNAVAPVSFSLINGLGIYSRAGVNSWGAWSYAGTNATGTFSRGGVNSGQSWLPAVLVILLLLVLSTVLRGKRMRRGDPEVVSLRRFLESPGLAQAKVEARLEAASGDGVELRDGRHVGSASCDAPVLERARSILASAQEQEPRVHAELVRTEERVIESRPLHEAGYREPPRETTRKVLRCTALQRAPQPETWAPKDAAEVQWVIAWTARLAALGAIVVLVLVSR